MSTSRGVFKKFCAAALGACMLMSMGSAQALASFDPVAAGLGGQVFEADSLVGGEVSRIDFGMPDADGNASWQEHGFLIVTGASLSGALQVPAGLGSDYTLFVSFDLIGVQPAAAAGFTTSAVVSMYAVQGTSSFGFDSNGLATATHQSTPTLVASLVDAQLFTYSYADPMNNGLPTLAAQISGLLVPTSPSFLTTSLQLFGTFYHPFQGLSFLNGGATVLIEGGLDTLNLSAVPEPATSAMWLGAALLLSLRRSLRRQALLDTLARPPA